VPWILSASHDAVDGQRRHRERSSCFRRCDHPLDRRFVVHDAHLNAENALLALVDQVTGGLFCISAATERTTGGSM
jgi:hypothetical protein